MFVQTLRDCSLSKTGVSQAQELFRSRYKYLPVPEDDIELVVTSPLTRTLETVRGRKNRMRGEKKEDENNGRRG
jgi:broad specificity phosphatase PhoE